MKANSWNGRRFEPWIENPRSLADAEAISDSVERSIGGLVPKMTAQEAVWAAGKAVRAGLAEEGAYLNRYVTDEQRSRRPIFIATKYLVFRGQDTSKQTARIA